MSVSPLGGGDKSVSPLGLCITHMSRCVRSGSKRSLWRRLPACVQVSPPPPAGAGRGRWCAGWTSSPWSDPTATFAAIIRFPFVT